MAGDLTLQDLLDEQDRTIQALDSRVRKLEQHSRLPQGFVQRLEDVERLVEQRLWDAAEVDARIGAVGDALTGLQEALEVRLQGLEARIDENMHLRATLKQQLDEVRASVKLLTGQLNSSEQGLLLKVARLEAVTDLGGEAA